MSEVETSLRKSTESGFKWSAAERSLNQGLTFVIQILLARILGPNEFGPLAIALIFFYLTEIFVDSGLGQSLIQAKSISKVDVATVFYSNLLISIVCYLVLWACAPHIANLYNEPIISPVSRWIFLNLIMSAFARTQMSLLNREMKFKKLFYITTPAILISGIVGLAMAFYGFGVWALVVQMNLRFAINATLLWVFSDRNHFPNLAFSFSSLKKLGSFGIYIFASDLIYKGSQHFYGLIIGKAFSIEQLALYNRANGFQKTPTGVLAQVFGRVLFPVFSRIQEDNEKIVKALRYGMPVLSCVIFPSMVFLMASSEPFIRTILSEKWLESADYLIVFPIVGMLFPLSAVLLTVIRSKGNSRALFLLSVAKNILAILLVLIAIQISILAIVISQAVVAVLGHAANALALHRYCAYKIGEQLQDTIPYLGLSLVSGITVWGIKYAPLSSPVVLFLQATLFLTIYFLLCVVFKLSGFVELTNRLVKMRRKRIDS